MSNKIILTGSMAFFGDILDFTPGDLDYIELVEDSIDSTIISYNKINNICFFKTIKKTPQEYINYLLIHGPAMAIASFLTPEFVQEINFGIHHLIQLKPLIKRLDMRHRYLGIIFNSYIKNYSFTLTPQQREEAYKEYLKCRR